MSRRTCAAAGAVVAAGGVADSAEHGELTVALPVALAAGCVLAVAVFPRSVWSVVSGLSSSDAGAIVALAPLAALVTGAFAVLRTGAPERVRLEPALLVAVPFALASALLEVFGTPRLGFAFWYERFDLVALGLLGWMLLVLVAGVRSTLGARGAGWLLVASAPPLLLPAATAVQRATTAITGAGSTAVARAFDLGVDPLGDGRFRLDDASVMSVASACSGIEGFLAVVLVAGPLFVVADGSALRKCMIVAGAACATLLLNLGRVVVLLGAAGRDLDRTVRVVHAVGGIVLIALVMATMLEAARRAGIRWQLPAVSTRVRLGRRQLVVAAALYLVAAVPAIAVQAGQAAHGLALSGVTRTIDLRGVQADGDGLLTATADVDVRTDRQYRWFREFFGARSRAASFTLQHPGRQPVWAQVVVGSSRRSLREFDPVDCFIAHGARLYRVRSVPLPGGSGTLVEQRQRSIAFSALSFTQPVLLDGGRTGFRRVMLFARAARGRDDQPSHVPALQRWTYRAFNVFSPRPTIGDGGYAYGPADRALVATAKAVLAAEDPV